MLTITDTFRSNRLFDTEEYFKQQYKIDNTAYFDIETTGLNARFHQIYLIGAACRNPDGTFTIYQWFDDTGKDEEKLLLVFREFLKNFQLLVHFNGNHFDVPFILQRASLYGLYFSFDHLIQTDLYQMIRPFKNLLKTPDLKQTSLEAFLGIARNDRFNGGQLIDVYRNDFLKNNDRFRNPSLSEESPKTILLLHNHDDMIGLVELCDLLSYTALCGGDFEIADISYTDDHQAMILHCRLSYILKSPLYDQKESYRLMAQNQSLKLLVSLTEEELKLYFRNYKEYYYLPAEDTAIHQSVALFVDKAYRKKATKETCYVKKQALFAPQPEEIITPAFKHNLHDRISYFIAEPAEKNDILLENETLKQYVLSILEYIRK